MSQDNLDQFFERKLRERSFAMKPDHWTGAQVMLKETNRKNRFAWIWWGNGIAATVIILFAFYNANFSKSSTVLIEQKKDYHGPIATSDDKSDKHETLNVEAISEQSKRKDPILENHNPQNLPSNSTPLTPTLQAKSSISENSISFNPPLNRSDNQGDAKKLNSESFSSDLATDNLKSNENADDMSAPTVMKENSDEYLDLNTPHSSIVSQKILAVLPGLSIQKLLVSQREIEPLQMNYVVISEHSRGPNNIQGFLFAGGVVSGFDPEGWNVGAGIEYAINARFALSLSTGYRRHAVSFTEQETAFYDLHANGTVFRAADVITSPNRFITLQNTLSVSYTYGKIIMSYGFRLDRLVKVYGTRTAVANIDPMNSPQLTDPSLVPTSSSTINFNKLVFRPWHSHTFMDMSYAVSHRFSVGAGVYYRLNSYLLPNSDLSSDLNSKWYNELRVKYNF